MIALLTDDAAVRRSLAGGWRVWLAIGFGAGLARYAPGTVGTLAAVPIGLALLLLPPAAFWGVVIAAGVSGIHLCGYTGRMLGRDDHSAIVWDEMIAFWVILGLVPSTGSWWLAAFVLFRLFDIVKPWPIRAIERRVRGGTGVMIDDLIAALFTLAVLLPANALLGWSPYQLA